MKTLTPEIKNFFDSIYRRIINHTDTKPESEDDQFNDTLMEELKSHMQQFLEWSLTNSWVHMMHIPNN